MANTKQLSASKLYPFTKAPRAQEDGFALARQTKRHRPGEALAFWVLTRAHKNVRSPLARRRQRVGRRRSSRGLFQQALHGAAEGGLGQEALMLIADLPLPVDEEGGRDRA